MAASTPKNCCNNAPENNKNLDGKYDDDDLSAEGAVFQGLFGHVDDDDDSSEEGEHHRSTNRIKKTNDVIEKEQENVVIRRQIMHVEIEELQIGGSIAHRLWPPAEHLARFILDAAAGKYIDRSSNGITHNDANENKSTATDSTEGPRALSHEYSRRILLQKQEMLHKKVYQLFSSAKGLPILELGAGLGLTGLELATQLDGVNTHVLLTELEDGLPMLRRNLELNQHKFRNGVDTVQVQRLTWGVPDEYDAALDWYHALTKAQSQKPLLIIGSDCVYWSELHKPLESALCGLLSRAPAGSMCLLAGVRRWKSDNAFYQSLGKYTRTKTHELQCTLLQETVQRKDGDRTVLRIYAIQWAQIRRYS
mmetsp:Transcript_23224/g.35858  ORF Transcript_23224/g.35858 Transcript_23224/m.35858 type:complete len:365 (+) Transcript_23224:104-1198(+)